MLRPRTCGRYSNMCVCQACVGDPLATAKGDGTGACASLSPPTRASTLVFGRAHRTACKRTRFFLVQLSGGGEGLALQYSAARIETAYEGGVGFTRARAVCRVCDGLLSEQGQVVVFAEEL